MHVLIVTLLLLAASGRAAENVKAWGSSEYGQLGNGIAGFTNPGTQSPEAVPGLSGVKAVAAGAGFSLALKNDGTVWAWGDIELGNDYRDDGLPAKVSNLSGIVAIAAWGGWDIVWWPSLYVWGHGLALKSDGTVWQWPSDGKPVAVASLSHVVAIAAGYEGSVALKDDGTVWRWYGDQLPTRAGDLTGVVAIAAGNYDLLALKRDGTVWQYAMDDYGGYTWCVISNLNGVVEIGTSQQNLALRSDGTVWGWYYPNDVYQVSSGARSVSGGVIVPADRTVNGVTDVVSGATWEGYCCAELGHTLALKSDGTVWASGSNRFGQLGNGDGLYVQTPNRVKSLAGVAAIAGGGTNSLALKSDGSVWEWGCEGAFGLDLDWYYPICQTRETPAAVTIADGGSLDNVAGIASGDIHSLALKGDGTVWAWGYNESGQLGNGTKDRVAAYDCPSWPPIRHDPAAVSNLNNVVAIAGGGAHTSELCDGFHYFPAGGAHSLALKNDGTVWAWGSNQYGQLGNGNELDSYVPAAINLSGVVAVAAGGWHSLVQKSDGTVWSWGWNGFGQLGIGNRIRKIVPVQVSGLSGVVAIAANRDFSLALRSDGTVWGWGANFSGQLGNGTLVSSNVPVKMSGLTAVVAIGAGTGRSLALRTDGTVWMTGCQAFNLNRECVREPSTVPVQVKNLTDAVALASGESHSMAVVRGGIPVLEPDTRIVNFGNQGTGVSESTGYLNLTNGGDALLEVRAVTLLGVNASEFGKTADTCTASRVQPGASCGISLQFAPKAQGTRSAAVLITSNAPGSPHMVLLNGNGTVGAPITVSVTTPNGGEKLFTGTPYKIEWTATSGLALTKFDVQYSINGGAKFSGVPGCVGLAGSVRSCMWAAPGPVTAAGRIRVVAMDSGSRSGSDVSNANYSVVSGKATIAVTAPNTAVNWAIGSEHLITWTQNLGRPSG